MQYVAIPVPLLAVGRPLPVDLWTPSGQLLLRKGQPVVSAQHRDKLQEHQASATASDAQAWQRAYERMVYQLLGEGADLDTVSHAAMPSEIRESDYVVGQPLSGGWPDLQVVLRGILYQGGLAINPLPRLSGIQHKAAELLRADPDDSLFGLFQLLADSANGYCATHALLCAVVSDLTAAKLDLDTPRRQALFNAAMVMNIGMARTQDSLVLQSTQPHEAQRALISGHPELSVSVLQGFGLDDPWVLDLVRWHHTPQDAQALPDLALPRRILHTADIFIAKLAARKTRAALSPVRAVKSMVVGVAGEELGVGSAMAQAAGFYPPGTYVRLANGETALCVQRGERANMPWVISVLDKHGVPLGPQPCHGTDTPPTTIVGAVPSGTVRVHLSHERVRKARERLRAR